jgi:large subunit ribosomal protein L41
MNAIFQRLNHTIRQHATESFCWLHQQRFMSKYLSKAAKKRLVLTTKRAHKGFYKGNGATKEGRLTSKGKFIVNPLRRLELVLPDLAGFKVRPRGKKT